MITGTVLMIASLLLGGPDKPIMNGISKADSFTVDVKLPDSLNSADLELVIFHYNYLPFKNLNTERATYITGVKVKGVTSFRGGTDEGVASFAIRHKHQRAYENDFIFGKHFIAPGDHVSVDLSGEFPNLRGKGGEKIKLLQEYRDNGSKVRDSLSKLIAPYSKNDVHSFIDYRIKLAERLDNYWRNKLCAMKGSMSSPALSVALVEVVGDIQRLLISAINSRRSSMTTLDTSARGKLMQKLNLLHHRLAGTADAELRAMSDAWTEYELAYAILLRNLDTGNSIYDTFSLYPPGKLRDKLIISALFNYYAKDKNADSLFRNAAEQVSDSYYLSEIKHFIQKQGIGLPAPDFELLDRNGRKVSLTDFSGKVVFIDFWFRGCTACKIYFQKSVRSALLHFSGNTDVIFLSVCVEKNKEKWMAEVEKEYSSAPGMLHLYTGEREWEHPIIKDYAFNSAPMPLLIDKSGNFFSRDGDALGRKNAAQLIKTIEQCRAH